MTRDELIAVGAAAALTGLLGWRIYTGQRDAIQRGGRGHEYTRAAADRLPLDARIARTTPERMGSWFGPPLRPGHWGGHRICYPPTPGLEIERIIHGAPGCYNRTTPPALRGWLFTPPAEVDF